jgi:hypothetical protein
MYFYLAYQNVHLACGHKPTTVAVESGKPFGLQAPCASVDMYGTSVTDQIKVQVGTNPIVTLENQLLNMIGNRV